MTARAVAVVAGIAAACVPGSELSVSRVDAPRVIAVRAEPPEATPGEDEVTWTAVVAGPDGTATQARIDWAFCTRPRAPTDATVVSPSCAEGGPWLVGLGPAGLAARARVPADACRLVGPEAPPLGPDRRPQRAPDPDVTGGYYLPVRLAFDDLGVYSLDYARLRLRCARPDLPTDVARELGARHRPNRNPGLLGLTLRVGDAEVELPAEGAAAGPSVRAGDRATLVARWAEEAAEAYVRASFDGRRVEEAREALELTWFAAGGSFERAHTSAAPPVARSANLLEVESGRAAPLVVWVVLRDGRGGTDVRSYRLGVAP